MAWRKRQWRHGSMKIISSHENQRENGEKASWHNNIMAAYHLGMAWHGMASA